ADDARNAHSRKRLDEIAGSCECADRIVREFVDGVEREENLWSRRSRRTRRDRGTSTGRADTRSMSADAPSLIAERHTKRGARNGATALAYSRCRRDDASG